MPATVAAGALHTCAVTNGGGVACWGHNAHGVLGDGTTTDRLTPVAVNGLRTGVAVLAAGVQHTCALTTAGGVVCWGSASAGQLGAGPVTPPLTPVAVTGLSSGVTAIAAGAFHTCAVTSAGGVMCWGYNGQGQLGDGTTENRFTPVAVSGLSSGVTTIAAGAYYTCALTNVGGVACWGVNAFGQLGDGTTTGRPTPVAVTGLSNAVAAVSAGSQHTCALTTAGGVVCWGGNAAGQLGDGTTTPRLTPVAVSGLSSGVTGVEAGSIHSCALTNGAAVMCWGDNTAGQLGDGTTTGRPTPVAVTGIPNAVAAVSAGSEHTCAVTTQGRVACWGANELGRLGDGTTTNRLTPVTVLDGTAPVLSLDRSSLAFGAVSDGVRFINQTPSQTVRVAQAGAGTATWTAASTTPWLVVSPASGSGAATLTISTRFAPDLAGSQTGRITLTFTGAVGGASQINVTLSVASSTATASRPFGAFDTPAGDAAVLAGSIAVTGWTLDNIGVKQVELWRDIQPGETTPPGNSTPGDPRNGKVFIANASFVENARPDVEALYHNIPASYRAGWGYLLLTWGLFGQGNGTYTFYAFGVDQENNTATIGTKTVIISNNTATKPFGSIDTPAIGGDASGPTFGWGLTPKVNGVATCKIPPSGVQYSIDSGPLQPVVYGDARADIASLFPGFSNSAAAGGHAEINWASLTNSTHTIQWVLTDDCNRVDGVGSRYFNNPTGTALTAAETEGVVTAAPGLFGASRAAATESDAAITVARGYGQLPEIVDPGIAGSRTIEIKPGERIELRVPRGFEAAYQLGPRGERRALPVGSTWDEGSQTFYWQPAPGFLGRYRIVFSNGSERINVRVVVVP